MNHATQMRFNELCRRLGIDGERSAQMYRDLVALYSDGARAYHNLTHIDRMLSWLDASGDPSDAVELAIWFHDAIYKPLSRHNEANSAQYFIDHLGPFVAGPLVEDVERLILATDPTQPRSGKEDEDLIIDIDLSILGSPPEEYEAYQIAVRNEYAVVSDAAFAAGRSTILQSFLSQRIYVTEFFSQLEAQARANIERELETL